MAECWGKDTEFVSKGSSFLKVLTFGKILFCRIFELSFHLPTVGFCTGCFK